MADGEIKTIVTADIAPFERKLQDAKKAAERFSAQLGKQLSKGGSDFVKGVGDDVKAIQKLLPAFKRLSQPLKEIGERARPIAAALGRIAAGLDKVTASSSGAADGLLRVGRSMTVVNNVLSGITSKITQNAQATREFTQALGSISSSASRASSGIQKAGDEAKKTGRKVKKASKELKDFDAIMGGLADSASLVTGPLGGIASRISVVSRAASSGTLAIVGIATAITGFGIAVKDGIAESEKFQTSMLRIQGVLKATGSVAGVTAEEISQFASDLDLSTLGSALEIEEAASRLLLFKKVSGETFKDALRASQDFASIGIGSVTSNIQSLGAALQDPVAQLGRLERKFGVDFPQSLKDTIEALVEAGQLSRAQRLVMKQLQSQTEGTAESMATGLAGSLDTLSKRFSDFLRVLEESVYGTQRAQRFIDGISGSIETVTQKMNKFFSDKPDDVMLRALKERERALIRIQTFGRLPIIGDAYIEAEEEKIKLLDEQIAKQGELYKLALREQAFDKEAAELKAEIAEELAKQEAIEAEAAKRRKAEQNRLQSLRRVSLRSMKEEIAINEAILQTVDKMPMTLKQEQQERERITRLVRLGLKDARENISILEAQYDTLIKSNDEKEVARALEIKQRIEAAKTREEFERSYQSVKDTNMLLETRDKIAGQARKDESEITDLDLQIKAATKRMEAEEQIGTMKKLANKEAEVALRLAQREAEYAIQGILLEGELLENERARIDAIVARERALAAVEDQIEANKEAQEDALEKQKEFQENLASSFADLVTAGDDFKDVLSRIIQNLAKAAVEARTLALIQSEAPGLGSGGFTQGLTDLIKGFRFGAGGVDSSAPISPNVGAAVAHSGGVIGQIATQRVVPISNFINAPRFHNGLRQGERPAILEDGEEVIPKDQVGRRRDRGDVNVTFNVSTPNADSFKRSQRQMTRQARQAVAR